MSQPGASRLVHAARNHSTAPWSHNIKRDPFEQAVGIDTEVGRCPWAVRLAAPMTAFLYDWNMLPIGQQLWMEQLMSYEKFPPLQAPESYNLSGILDTVKKASNESRERLAA